MHCSKTKPEDSQLIQALKFAGKHPDGFSKEQLARHLNVKDFKWGKVVEYQFGRPETPSQQDRFFMQNGDFNIEEQHLHVLSVDGSKLLFDVIEMQEAKKQADKATRLAVISIAIAAVAAFL